MHKQPSPPDFAHVPETDQNIPIHTHAYMHTSNHDPLTLHMYQKPTKTKSQREDQKNQRQEQPTQKKDVIVGFLNIFAMGESSTNKEDDKHQKSDETTMASSSTPATPRGTLNSLTGPGETVTTPRGTVISPRGTVTTPRGTVITPRGTSRGIWDELVMGFSDDDGAERDQRRDSGSESQGNNILESIVKAVKLDDIGLPGVRYVCVMCYM
jgi:hypothetical protein